MALLTHDEVLGHTRSGLIHIEPLSEDQIGPGSVDLHLDCTFQRLKKTSEICHVTEDTSYGQDEGTELIELKDGEIFLLMPGETCQGITQEVVELASNISGWITGRSRFSRLGLMVYTSYVHPGSRGRQVLEITNNASRPLALHPGVLICQLILQETDGHAIYSGRFQNQWDP